MAEGLITLVGEVSRLRFGDEGRGFQVFDVRVSEPVEMAGRQVVAVGGLSDVQVGFNVRLNGDFQNHPRFGRQFRFLSGMVVPPETGRGLVAFLSSGRIEGIGPVLAKRLHQHFGEGLRAALDEGPATLIRCRGIGMGRAAAIHEAWKRGTSLREAAILLGEMGLTPAQAARITSVWGESAPARVAANPWDLQRFLRGFGFRSADRIALATGIASDAPARLEAALEYSLSSSAAQGHLFLDESRLIETAAALTGVPPDTLHRSLESLLAGGSLVADSLGGETVVYRREARVQELAAARQVAMLARSRCRPVVPLSGRDPGVLAPSQLLAIDRLMSSPVSVLTGGPGTGKTTVVSFLMGLCRDSGLRLALAAPTGRAAMRMRESSGHEAVTLHRLLEYNPATDSFARCSSNPIEADWVVVDESSMIDMEMFAMLVEAIRPGCRLTLVGDADQLPPVGAGDPFRQLIQSGRVPVARLTEVFRQGAGSSIVRAAHAVLAGEMPCSDRSSDVDPGEFHLVLREDPAAAAEMVIALVCDRIPARFGLDPSRDIQILAPMKKGSCGTDALNESVRRRLNLTDQSDGDDGPRFVPGDRVIHNRNNYDLEVFNGDIGIVSGTMDNGSISVAFEGRDVFFKPEDQEDLSAASAVTVHKAQGSEFPAVVTCLHDQHFVMLRRNLLYTALTRGRKLVVLVGSGRAIRMALSNHREEVRNTMLAARLVRAFEAGAPDPT